MKGWTRLILNKSRRHLVSMSWSATKYVVHSICLYVILHLQCYRRKRSCSGERPTCGTCSIKGSTCTYTVDEPDDPLSLVVKSRRSLDDVKTTYRQESEDSPGSAMSVEYVNKITRHFSNQLDVVESSFMLSRMLHLVSKRFWIFERKHQLFLPQHHGYLKNLINCSYLRAVRRKGSYTGRYK